MALLHLGLHGRLGLGCRPGLGCWLEECLGLRCCLWLGEIPLRLCSVATPATGAPKPLLLLAPLLEVACLVLPLLLLLTLDQGLATAITQDGILRNLEHGYCLGSKAAGHLQRRQLP